jgi:hypothetical protein
MTNADICIQKLHLLSKTGAVQSYDLKMQYHLKVMSYFNDLKLMHTCG